MLLFSLYRSRKQRFSRQRSIYYVFSIQRSSEVRLRYVRRMRRLSGGLAAFLLSASGFARPRGIDDKRRVLATVRDKIRRRKAPRSLQGAAFLSRPCSFGESSPSTMRRDTSVATQKNEHSRADAQMISPSTDSKPPPSAYFLCRRRRAYWKGTRGSPQ